MLLFKSYILPFPLKRLGKSWCWCSKGQIWLHLAGHLLITLLVTSINSFHLKSERFFLLLCYYLLSVAFSCKVRHFSSHSTTISWESNNLWVVFVSLSYLFNQPFLQDIYRIFCFQMFQTKKMSWGQWEKSWWIVEVQADQYKDGLRLVGKKLIIYKQMMCDPIFRKLYIFNITI